jgi:transcriptional regulator with XRE-family HTH domain
LKANKLKELREQKGYSQTEFAKEIGLSRSFLAQIESGKGKLPEKYIEKTCLLLHATEDEIFGYSEIKKIDDEILANAVEIIDSVVDASDLTKKQRLILIERAYHMINEVVEKNLSPEQLETEVQKLKQDAEKELMETKETKKNILKLFKNLTKK